MAISEQWAYLLDPGLRSIFELQRDALAAEAVAPQLFSVQSSSKAVEYDLSVGGFADWQEYKGAISYDEHEQGFRTSYTHVEFARGFRVERKLVDDDQYNVINKRPAGLALSAMRKREKDAASVFNNAFTAANAGGDGISLCDGSHPMSPSNAAVQDNEGTTALSYDAVVATREIMRAFEDDRGELVQVRPDTLLVPPELEEEAFAIMKTANKVDIADYHANFVASALSKVIVWDYLTDANNWFLIDSKLCKIYLNWFDRVPLEFAMDPTSDFSLEARFRGYMRYSYGWSDWRFVYGHTVT
ncbi:MAG TPA: Mu-like prophage major head subunit gpT family protein [Anaerolineae bacterium]|nr:Mu-like prophage major head subunit gpT family protein [Anaerolineae bacterium]